MQKILRDCVGWLNWQMAVLIGLIMLGGLWYSAGTNWWLWLSASPLLGLALCVLPCLLPLVWFWRKGNGGSSTPVATGITEREGLK